MPRTTKPVDRDKLVAAIQMAEANGPLGTQKKLWDKAAEIYNASRGTMEEITHSVVYLRCREWNLEIKTGARGPKKMTEEHKAKFLASRGNTPRLGRGEKFAASSEHQKAFEALRKRTPINLHVLVDKVQKGSMKASVKLMCIQCFGHEHYHEGIRECTSKACALWSMRPYQVGKTDDDATPDDVAAEAAA